MALVKAKQFTPIFAPYLWHYRKDPAEGIDAAISKMDQHVLMQLDYPVIPDCAIAAGRGLNRVLLRGPAQAREYFLRMTAPQLARSFAKAINKLGWSTYGEYEDFFRAMGAE